MFTDSAEGRKIVAELTFEVVGEIAPEEHEIFNELLHEYYQPAKPTKTGKGGSDDPLGFGLEGVVHLMTPAVAALVTTLLNGLLAEAAKSLQEEGAAAIRNKIKTLLNPGQEKKPAGKETGQDRPGETKEGGQKAHKEERPSGVDFSREQLAAILKNAKSAARKQGASDEEAERIANALFVRLALA
jgi:hypothetical protein